MRPFVGDGCSALSAKASCRPGRLIVKACDLRPALGHAKAAAPAADISRIGCPVRAPRWAGMIVPGPSCGNADLELHRATKALACRRCCVLFRRVGHVHPSCGNREPRAELILRL